MPCIRFSLKWMFAMAAFAAVAAAALTDGSARWAALIALASACALLASILGVIYRRGERRSFWIGFAVFGWAYLLVSQESLGLGEAMPVNVFLKEMYPFFRRTAPFDPVAPDSSSMQNVERESGGRTVAVLVTQYDFHRLGHSICAILFALAGGWLGRWFFATMERDGRERKSSESQVAEKKLD